MSILDKIVKKFNNEDVIKFSDKDDFANMKSWVSASSGALDYNLKTKGFPCGIVEIAGPSRSGKTTLALQAMKHFIDQHEDGICCILSSENRDNKDYALKLGIDPSKIIIIKVRYVEKMFMMVKKLIEDVETIFKDEKLNVKDMRFFFMWDSLGATLSKSELDTMDENTENMSKKFDKGDDISDLKHEKIGAFAKTAKMFAKYLLSEMFDKTIHFIILNHQYDKIGGHGKKSTGGEWVEYLPCLRLSANIVENIKIDEVVVAQITRVSVVKNDFGSRVPTDIQILLGQGIIMSDDDIEFALESGILKKEGVKKMSFLDGKLTWSSSREFFKHYTDNNPFMKILHKKVLSRWHQRVMIERGYEDSILKDE